MYEHVNIGTYRLYRQQWQITGRHDLLSLYMR